MVNSINCIKINVSQNDVFEKKIKLVAEIKAVFGFIIRVTYSKPINTTYSFYNKAEELIWCSQATSNNNNLSDSMYKLTKMTNNIAGLDIGIAKHNEKYYLYCNEQCTLYCYIIQGSYPILDVLSTPITENYTIVAPLELGRFNLTPNNNFRDIPKGFITTPKKIPYINLSDDPLKCEWQKIPTIISYTSGYIKIKVTANSESVTILYDNEGYTSETLVSFRYFVYEGVKYFRCFAKVISTNNNNIYKPLIYKDDNEDYIYIKSDSKLKLLNYNSDITKVDNVDTSNLEVVNISSNIIEDNIFVENYSIAFDKDTNNIFASYNGKWNNMFISKINNGNKIYKIILSEHQKLHINIQSIDDNNISSNVNIYVYYSSSGHSVHINDNGTKPNKNIEVFLNGNELYLKVISTTHYINDVWSTVSNIKLETVSSVPENSVKQKSSYNIVDNYTDYLGADYHIFYAKDLQSYLYSTTNIYYNKEYHYLDGSLVGKTEGAFSNKPKSPKIGYSYFCTDKQTVEGATDGIMIYHKGDDVWVDALGRVIE